MITDAMLREAAMEAEESYLAGLEDQEPHVFSERFERRMRKLIARAVHPVRYQVLRYTAAVLLAIITLFGVAFAASPEVRAAVSGWVRSTFGEYFQYESDDTPTPVTAEYELTRLPDGYRLLQVIEKTSGKLYVFVNESNDFLQFEYDCGSSNTNLFVNAENCEQQTGYVNGIPADLYLSTKEEESSVIVWQDRETKTLFHIQALADADALIDMAESVQKKK